MTGTLSNCSPLPSVRHRWQRRRQPRRQNVAGRSYVFIFVFFALLLMGPLTREGGGPTFVSGVVGRAYAQVGGAFPDFVWGARFKATLLRGAGFDDAFASLHNPAALRGCDGRQLGVEQIRPFAVPVTALAWCGTGAEGEGRLRLRTGGHFIARQTPPGLAFDYNTYTFALSGALQWRTGDVAFGTGVTPKLLFVSIAGTETGHDDRAFGYALDVGAVVDVPLRFWIFDTFSLSVAAADVTSHIKYGSGAVEPAATSRYRGAMTVAGTRLKAGVAVESGRGETTWAVGGEYVVTGERFAADVLDGVALRVGIGSGETAVGIGVMLRSLSIDYAYTWKGNETDEDTLHAFSTRLYF